MSHCICNTTYLSFALATHLFIPLFDNNNNTINNTNNTNDNNDNQ